MRKLLLGAGVALGLALTGWTGAAARQDGCRAPALVPSKEPNIFSPAQEIDYGDAVAERFEPVLRLIEEPAVTGRLEAIGRLLVSRLPETGLTFRFKLVDLPDADAFAMPGGRVYVSRKLIALTRTEDELAGVLGHELGHLVARQHTIDATRQLREVLGVTQLGDRADVFAKYNQLMENAGKKPGAFYSVDREARQVEADRLGLFIVAAAGYDPEAHLRFFDRLAQTGGRTGSALSNMFGMTSPDSRRLGEIAKNLGTIPATCLSAQPRKADDYQTWQAQVAMYALAGRTPSLPGLVSQKTLTALPLEINHLRFSPDGRLLLAQDDAGITVLTRDPLASLLRIDAADAEPAQFTPDSANLIFNTSDLRIERWSIATRRLAEVHEVYRLTACTATALSPDGRTLACVDIYDELSLTDVNTNERWLQRKNFQYPLQFSSGLGGTPVAERRPPNIAMAFSPDGRFFVAGSRGQTTNSVLVLDMTNRRPIALKGNAQNIVVASFAFIGPGRLAGVNMLNRSKSGIVRLPEGDVTETFTLPFARFAGAARGDVLFIRPFDKYAVGMLDLVKKAVTKGSASEAMDVYADTYVAERGTGDLALYTMDGNQVRGSVTLPPTRLARVRAAAVSPDFRWVALSARTRGALWNAETGDRVALVRDFSGAFVDDDGSLFADLPKAGPDPRAIMRLDGPARFLSSVGEITDLLAVQYGRTLLAIHPIPPDTLTPTGLEFELRDVRTAATLWRKTFAKNPPDGFWFHSESEAFVTMWSATSPQAREMIRADADLRGAVNATDLAGDYVLECSDTQTGALRRRIMLDTERGSYRILGVLVKGNRMFVTDSLGRILVYLLSTGEAVGYVIGAYPAVGGDSFAVETGPGSISIHDSATLQRRKDLTFAHDIVIKRLSADGKRLFVLTADQQAAVINVR